jgi:hypothetical protein
MFVIETSKVETNSCIYIFNNLILIELNELTALIFGSSGKQI